MVNEITSFVIAIISIILSIYNFIAPFVRNRKKIEIIIPNVFRFGNGNQTSDVLNIKFINKSREAITISQMVISCERKGDGFGKYNKRLMNHTSKSGNEITERRIWTADVLPVKIEGLGFFSGLLVSDGNMPVIIPDNECDITLLTNKGPIHSKYKFADFSDWKLLSECRFPD
jgi:hypothetical protein